MESQKNVFFVSPTLSPYGNTDRGARGASMFKFGVNPAVLVFPGIGCCGPVFWHMPIVCAACDLYIVLACVCLYVISCEPLGCVVRCCPIFQLL
jgi:hypothetical protein